MAVLIGAGLPWVVPSATAAFWRDPGPPLGVEGPPGATPPPPLQHHPLVERSVHGLSAERVCISLEVLLAVVNDEAVALLGKLPSDAPRFSLSHVVEPLKGDVVGDYCEFLAEEIIPKGSHSPLDC